MLRSSRAGPADLVVIKFLLPSQRLKVCTGEGRVPALQPGAASQTTSSLTVPGRTCQSPGSRSPAPGVATAPSTLRTTRGEGPTLSGSPRVCSCAVGCRGGPEENAQVLIGKSHTQVHYARVLWSLFPDRS